MDTRKRIPPVGEGKDRGSWKKLIRPMGKKKKEVGE